jgi:outer membrane murein-binding lipoprotein Lpp
MKFIIAAIALATTSLAFANSCPMQMKEIDAKISTNPQLSAADMGKVKTLRTDGEAFHKAGKHAESEKALGEAKKLLGM